VRIRFWGTRGSIPTPGKGTTLYGGNTSCVEVRGDDGTVILFDCGTGARPLGLDLLDRAPALPPMHILVSHTHWDHIQGFPFFMPAYTTGGRLSVYGARGVDRTLEGSLSGQMQHTYFPVQLDELRAEIAFEELGEEQFRVGPYRATSQLINHTTATLGYRLDGQNASIAYVTDHEPFWWESSRGRQWHRFLHPGEERHLAFIAGVDVLIHDSQYADFEYPARHGWGHSTIEYAVDVAVRGGVRHLVLFHHDPTHSDAWIRQQLLRARRRAAAQGSPLEVSAAAEGAELDVPEQGGVPIAPPTMEPAPTGRILVAGTDRHIIDDVREALGADHDDIVDIDMGQVLTTAARGRIDLLILAGPGSETMLLQVAADVHAQTGTENLPVLVLPAAEGAGAMGRLADPVTDVLSRPFNPAMLRPRVRAWLARSGKHVDRPVERRPRRIGAAREQGLLRGLPVAERAALLTGAIVCRFRPGEVIFKQGDASGGIYFIREGRMEISLQFPDGNSRILGTAGAGETVGELAALDGGPRTATVRAVEATVADYLPRDILEPSLAAAPSVAYRLMHQMASNLRRSDSVIGELTLHRSSPEA
jgi:phosphoribosyl 1,2-cyclic phosphodiesterase